MQNPLVVLHCVRRETTTFTLNLKSNIGVIESLILSVDLTIFIWRTRSIAYGVREILNHFFHGTKKIVRLLGKGTLNHLHQLLRMSLEAPM